MATFIVTVEPRFDGVALGRLDPTQSASVALGSADPTLPDRVALSCIVDSPSPDRVAPAGADPEPKLLNRL
jgi:hypothetical protein